MDSSNIDVDSDRHSGDTICLGIFGRLPTKTVETIAKIMAIGLVLAVLELITLSFIYPTRLSTVAGIVTPVLTVYLQWRAQKHKRIKQRHGENNGNTAIPDKLSGH